MTHRFLGAIERSLSCWPKLELRRLIPLQK